MSITSLRVCRFCLSTASFARSTPMWSRGEIKVNRTAIIAITISNSINVNALIFLKKGIFSLQFFGCSTNFGTVPHLILCQGLTNTHRRRLRLPVGYWLHLHNYVYPMSSLPVTAAPRKDREEVSARTSFFFCSDP